VLAMTSENLREMQGNDPELKPMILYLENRSLPEDAKLAHRLVVESNDYFLDNGVLFHLYYPRGNVLKSERVIKQLVVPKALQNDISYALTTDHQGIERTYHSIRLKYIWYKMVQDIQYYCKSCEVCARAKHIIEMHH